MKRARFTEEQIISVLKEHEAGREDFWAVIVSRIDDQLARNRQPPDPEQRRPAL